MALVTCPECGKPNVSSTATSCPYCGYNLKLHFEKEERAQRMAIAKEQAQQQTAAKPKSPSLLKTVLLTVIVILGIIFLWNHMPGKSHKYECYFCGKGIDAYHLVDNHYTCNSCYRTLQELSGK